MPKLRKQSKNSLPKPMKAASRKAKGKYRRWTKEEDRLLIKLYNKKTNYELGEIFNRHYDKITRRATRLGIRKLKEISDKHVSKALKLKFSNGDLSNKGANNPMWKGGKRICKGYILVYVPEHPFAYKNYYSEHRLLMEKQIGRYLKKNEIVHHINYKKTDNRIENLVLLNGIAEHMKYHIKESMKNLAKTPSHQKNA